MVLSGSLSFMQGKKEVKLDPIPWTGSGLFVRDPTKQINCHPGTPDSADPIAPFLRLELITDPVEVPGSGVDQCILPRPFSYSHTTM